MVIKFFHAEWCAPCNQFFPVIKKYCEDNCITFEDHDVDNSTEVDKFGIRSVPTTVILSDDNEVLSRISTVMTKQQLDELINNLK